MVEINYYDILHEYWYNSRKIKNFKLEKYPDGFKVINNSGKILLHVYEDRPNMSIHLKKEKEICDLFFKILIRKKKIQFLLNDKLF